MEHYRDHLFNPHWGEQVASPDKILMRLSMVSQGLTREAARRRPGSLSWTGSLRAATRINGRAPSRCWKSPHGGSGTSTPEAERAPGHRDGRAAPARRRKTSYWAGDGGQAGQFLLAYRSAWLPAALLADDARGALVDALVAASRQWAFALHFNKGLAGAPAEDIARSRDTATNPAVLDAFALAIIAADHDPALPGIPGHEPDLDAARKEADRRRPCDGVAARCRARRGVVCVRERLLRAATGSDSFWGGNYARLLAVKHRYDPDGLFFVHHGVGSEAWSPDGFTRLA